MNVIIGLLLVLSAVRLWVGIQLILTGRKYQLTNLYWLSAFSIIVAVAVMFAPTTPPTPLSNPPIYYIGALLGQMCLVMFLHITFYQGRKSPVALFLSLTSLALLGVLYALWANDSYLGGLLTSLAALANWSWHLWLAWQAYQTIATDKDVEDWVKARYQLMSAFAVVILLSNIQASLALSYLAPLMPPFVTQSAIVFNVVGIILLFLVWAMPVPFRRWLNRNQQIHTTERAKADARALLNIFSAAMANQNMLSEMICLVAIRSTIGKMIGTEDTATIETHVNRMTYREWEQVLQHAELRRIISNAGTSAMVEQALANVNKALVEKQSLFTLAAK
jgi:hypothetical protein